MHAKGSCGGRDIATVLPEHFLQMLPFQPANGEGLFLDLDEFVTLVLVEGGNNFVGIRWFRKIVHRTELDGLHRRSNTRKAGQHNNAGIRIQIMKFFYQHQTGLLSYTEVDDGKFRLNLLSQTDSGFHVVSGINLKSTLIQGLPQHSTKGRVIIHKQQDGFL